jgi:3-dehydroquinate synthase
MIGAFYQPRAVLSDTATMRTLNDREYRAGIAEVIKYGAIRDLVLFEWLESNIDALAERRPEALTHAVIESCRIKAGIVAADERETAERALLNFGHTFAHAIETATGYATWIHGEAVAAGMVLASRLSTVASGLPPSDADRLVDLVSRAGLPVEAPRISRSAWIEAMSRDKKSEGGRMRFILLEALGRAVIRGDITSEQLSACLQG